MRKKFHLIEKFEGYEFESLEVHEFRAISIKSMFAASDQRMNLRGHEEFELEKDVPMYKYHACSAK